MKNLKEFVADHIGEQHFDHIAVGVIDFTQGDYQSVLFKDKKHQKNVDAVYFDLASITKPLVLGCSFLQKKESFDEQDRLLLNHRAGLMSGGRLSSYNWKEYISSLELKESPPLYSDYSALRLQIELEKKVGSLYDLNRPLWDPEIVHWLDIKEKHRCVETGIRRGKMIRGDVHDDNSYNIKEYLSHAGLFSTVGGLCRTMLSYDQSFSLLNVMEEAFEEEKGLQRFLNGWDTVQDDQKSLAGPGCSKKTFGHLGFTGTSLWIDCVKRRGCVLLTNETKRYWYDRKGLNDLRRSLGSYCWE